MAFAFPKTYPILDSSFIPSANRADFLRKLGHSLADAGITLLEYRNKIGSDGEHLADCAILRSALPAPNIKLVLDDRAHLVVEARFDGVHVDSGDRTPTEARMLLGPDCLIGTFGGCACLLPGILDEPVDYWAIGPVYATTTKQTAFNPIGPEGVRRLREDAGPDIVLTAAAGITLDNAAEVLAAGATTVAVSAALFRTADPAAEFKRWMQQLR
jgi:thiamine-phosphate pyrophosphorylase